MCSGPAIKWGHTSTGVRRYFCPPCHRTFHRVRAIAETSSYDAFLLFRTWILRNTTREGIADDQSCSRMTIYTAFLPFLTRPPSPELLIRVVPPVAMCGTTTNWAYGLDGFWFHRDRIVLLQRDVTHKETLWWSLHLSESAVSALPAIESCGRVVDHDHLVGVVSDWKSALRTSTRTVFGNCPHQRCLTHVVRQAKRLLPEGSPFLATRRLRDMAAALHRINTMEDRDVWYAMMTRWGYLYGDMLTEKTIAPKESHRHWWYTHGNLRRAWRLLTHEHTTLFQYLAVPLLPATNNSLEGVNRSLAGKISIHRGLTTDLQVSLVFWSCAFSRTKTQEQIRRLWDTWKKDK